MIKRAFWTGFVVILSMFFIFAAADEKVCNETVTCPVSGETVKKSEAKATYEYEGTTYYFCCPNCKESFMKDPGKYIGKKESECCMLACGGMVIDPVCSMEIKKEDVKATHEHDGKTYYFCSQGCKDKFVQDPGKYVRADDKVVTCPVSGKSFNKTEMTESLEYEGKTYYFCCTGCKTEFQTNPEKYVTKGIK